jgi:hypothetical protein
MRQRVSAIARINFSIAALFVLAAVCWPFVQQGVNWYYKRELNAFFELIEKGEIKHKLIYNQYLPFGIKNNADPFEKLELDSKDTKYFNFAVVEKDDRTFFIIAQFKPEIFKRWYLNTTKTKLRYIYEKKEGETGRLVDSLTLIP